MANTSSLSPPETHASKLIFLSYSRTDREACIALRSALEQVGLALFQDEDKIRIGDQWLTRLEETLQGCRAFVVLIGRDGIQRWVGAEVQVALNRYFSPHDDARRLPIFPILLDEATPESLPPFLALFQTEIWSPGKPLPAQLIEAIQAKVIRIDDSQFFEGCPFLGLSAFSRNDARLFFGRRQETLQALACLGDQQQTNPEQLYQCSGSTYYRWLQIEGNSGSGKSSLVNAGMLPMIEQGALWARTGFEHWRILGPMMPGNCPLAKLAETLEQGLIEDREKRDSLKRLKRLEEDHRALAFAIKDFKHANDKTAFLLIVDQFEELFTFADITERKKFDALLANALQDLECPLFLISTVRADFLDRFEYLPDLQTIYNSQCKRYFLPLISTKGIREIIEQPARLAGLDVTEVSFAILNDAKDEIGALPLVENALYILWEHRQNNKLSGEHYQQENGIAGMLSKAADKLLDRVEKAFPKKGKQAALEMLLALTRVNDEGRNTRKRITREDAIYAAGKGDNKLGEQVLQMLSGARSANVPSASPNTTLRLITLSREKNLEGEEQQFVDLIHETLVRARPSDENTRKPEGYWPTLYQYIAANPDREILRQQLNFKAKQWQDSTALGKIRRLSYSYFDLKHYRQLGVRAKTLEGKFLVWSKRAQVAILLVISSIVLIVLYSAESIFWVQKHDLPLDMIWTLQRFRFGDPVLPVLTDKPIPIGSFDMGEQDQEFIDDAGEFKKLYGVPVKSIQITQPFYLGKTEVTYEQFDYFVWQQHRAGNMEISFPGTVKGGRGRQPAVNVNWYEAVAYAKWLGKMYNQCRLPTEAEWEYAARAGTRTAYPWGNGLGVNNANCGRCGSQWDNQQASPVGSFAANPFGLYDMAGNVMEWTCSNWREHFDGSEQQCDKGIMNTQNRVSRGGSWNSHPEDVRASSRFNLDPVLRYEFVGFRVLCSFPIE